MRVTKRAENMGKAPPKPTFKTRRGNGEVVLAGVDGRSLIARRFREITAGIEQDLGGDLTEAQKHLISKAAAPIVWTEDRESDLARGEDFDAVQYATIANAIRRLLNDLGLERKLKDVGDLSSYIRGRA